MILVSHDGLDIKVILGMLTTVSIGTIDPSKRIERSRGVLKREMGSRVPSLTPGYWVFLPVANLLARGWEMPVSQNCFP